ncbi:hypothetical protein BDR26DRAFT_915258 [Obelidium mucronatum]|nr:hypothetical protein BDR26DRAFT_915258 [Obelidium mucronatum]
MLLSLVAFSVLASAQSYLGCFRSNPAESFPVTGEKQCLSNCVQRGKSLAALSIRSTAMNDTLSSCFCSSTMSDFDQIGQYCGVMCLDNDSYACGRENSTVDYSVYSNIGPMFSQASINFYTSLQLNQSYPFISHSAGCYTHSRSGAEISGASECIGVCEKESSLIAAVRYDLNSKKLYCSCSNNPSEFRNDGMYCGIPCPDSTQTLMSCGSTSRDTTFSVYSQKGVVFPASSDTGSGFASSAYFITSSVAGGICSVCLAIAAYGYYAKKKQREAQTAFETL